LCPNSSSRSESTAEYRTSLSAVISIGMRNPFFA
jgi:hypothetical protein